MKTLLIRNLLHQRYFVAMVMAIVGIMNVYAQQLPVEVTWTMGRNEAAKNMYSSSFTIKNISNAPLDANWDFYYNNFPRKMKIITENPQITISQFRPGYNKISPTDSYKALAPGESITVEFLTLYSFRNLSYSPDGGHFVYRDRKENPLPVDIRKPLMTDTLQWSIPGAPLPAYPNGKFCYERNSIINPSGAKIEGSIYNIIPTPKNIEIKKGVTSVSSKVKIEAAGLDLSKAYLVEKLAANDIKESAKAKTTITLSQLKEKQANAEYYKITVDRNKIEISGATEVAVLNGIKTLIAVIERGDGKLPMSIPNAVITDYPDLSHRGMMLDVSRNFTNYESLRRYIDMLAAFKVNIFQFHFSDDEAWRLEIPGIPELTEVASKKGLAFDEKDFLYQTYAGNGNPNDLTTTANGYVSIKQFVELLKYAQQRGVAIIPEVEAPGHARAAIFAMKARERKYRNTDPYKAGEFKLWDDADTAKYTSSQGYHDNSFNFAQEGTYRFLGKVFDGIIEMYKEAGVKLPAIHIGGDEVPDGAWSGSPMINSFMAKHNMKTTHEGGEYFLDRATKMLEERGVKAGGWQEVAVHHSKEFNAKVAPRFAMVNVWSTMGSNDSIPYHVANSGYPVVISNVNNFYFDMVYSRHENEFGLNWGGKVDEFDSWNALPYNMYRSARRNNHDKLVDLSNADKGKPTLKNRANIIGVQGQLWSETIRNFDMVSSYTFPRIVGLAERGWNATPEWSEDYTDMTRYNAASVQYNLKLGKELQRFKKAKLDFHLGQPGIMVKDGMIYINTQLPGQVVRYTTDGSEPTEKSEQWTEPVKYDKGIQTPNENSPRNPSASNQVKLIKAKVFYLGKESLTTRLDLK
ncbi:MAG: family 20 glycosylhydrolase [Muribaculaceae bacterium]|nr:family 20 glycosylhydrolase [Muribaculaceae bacterium]